MNKRLVGLFVAGCVIVPSLVTAQTDPLEIINRVDRLLRGDGSRHGELGAGDDDGTLVSRY